MQLGKALFARFGLFTRKTEGPDVFDLRLQRIRSRERRLVLRKVLFRGLSRPREA